MNFYSDWIGFQSLAFVGLEMIHFLLNVVIVFAAMGILAGLWMLAEPRIFGEPSMAHRKGWFGRLLDRFSA